MNNSYFLITRGVSDGDFIRYLRKKLGICCIEGGSGGVSSVNGQTGIVVLEPSDIGLSEVDNTSDLDKPVSTDTQAALDAKLNSSLLSGGSTGQVLKKNSNGNYDFVWAEDEGYDTIYVANYAALPDPTTVPDTLYGVLNSTGTPYISVLFGGDYRPKGFYYSNGTAWIYLGEFPIQATDSEVATGTVTNKFVAPDTLMNNYFKKGGNSFGAAVSLGTNDNNTLSFKTNNVDRGNFTTGGDLLLNERLGLGAGPSIVAKLQIGTLAGVNGGDFYSFNSVANPRFLFGENSNGARFGGMLWDRTTQQIRIFNSGFSSTSGICITTLGGTGLGGSNQPDSYPGSRCVVLSPDGNGITIAGTTTSATNYLYFNDTANVSSFQGYVGYSHSLDQMRFGTGGVARHFLNGIGLANHNAIDNSALLHFNSTTRGVLFPRMTEADRLAIASPAIGLEVYQTDATEGKYIYTSTGWRQLAFV